FQSSCHYPPLHSFPTRRSSDLKNGGFFQAPIFKLLKLRRVPLFFLQPVEFVLSSSCTFISAAISVELVSYCYFELARVPYVILRNVKFIIISSDSGFLSMEYVVSF